MQIIYAQVDVQYYAEESYSIYPVSTLPAWGIHVHVGTSGVSGKFVSLGLVFYQAYPLARRKMQYWATKANSTYMYKL